MFTGIPHPNVFEEYNYDSWTPIVDRYWVCLNMLRDPDQGKYSGWTSAYSVQSILVQLQTFLMAENIPQDYGNFFLNFL